MSDDPTAPHDPVDPTDPGTGAGEPTQAMPVPETGDATAEIPTVGADPTTVQPVIPPPVEPPPPDAGPGDEPPEGGGNGWKIAIIALLALIAVLLLVALLLMDSDDEPSDATTTSTTTSSTTTTTSSTTSTTAPTTTTTAPTTTTTAPPATGPAITSLQASAIACPDPLTLTWTSERATSVEVAIDNPGGVFEDGLPPNGSLEVPAPCGGDTQTYYVTAVDDIGDRRTETLTLP